MAGVVPFLLCHCLVALATAVYIVLVCTKSSKKKKGSEVSAASSLPAKTSEGAKSPVPPPSNCPKIGELLPPEPKKEVVVPTTSITPQKGAELVQPKEGPLPKLPVDPKTPSLEPTQSREKTRGGSRESEKEQSEDEKGQKLRSENDDETLDMVRTNFGDEHTVRVKAPSAENGRQSADATSAEPVPSIAEAHKKIADDKKRSTRRGDKKRDGRSSRRDKRRRGGSKREYSDESGERSDVKGRSERDDKYSKRSAKRGWMTKDDDKREPQIIEATQFSTKSRPESD